MDTSQLPFWNKDYRRERVERRRKKKKTERGCCMSSICGNKMQSLIFQIWRKRVIQKRETSQKCRRWCVYVVKMQVKGYSALPYIIRT